MDLMCLQGFVLTKDGVKLKVDTAVRKKVNLSSYINSETVD
jgi:hypothetical protein